MRRSFATHCVVVALTPLFGVQTHAGDLDPAPGPVAPTMHRLDELLPSTPISSIPTTITQPGAYHLTADLTGSPGLDGITINLPALAYAEIDFRGFSLIGPPGALVGVRVHTTGCITLKRGVISGWDHSLKDVTIASKNATPQRMKIRPLQDRVLSMVLADSALDAISIDSDTTLLIENTIITGAAGHAVRSDGGRTVLDNVQILSVGGDGVHVPASAREHILLARQVSIHDTDGDGVDAADAAVTLQEVSIDASGGDNAVLGDGARLINIKLRDAAGKNLRTGHDAWIDVLAATGGSTGALEVGDNCELHRVTADASSSVLLAGENLVLHDSHTTGTVISGVYVNAQRNIMTVDIDAAQSITFGDGKHGARLNTFNAHGTNTANLPAFIFQGNDVAILHNQFNVIDPPVGGPTAASLRMPPHYTSLDGLRFDFRHNAVHSIHPGTEAVIATGDAHVITDNLITGVGQNATGLIYTGNGALIARNTVSHIGSGGTPFLITGVGNVLAPIVTGSAIGANTNPDRNLHIP